MFISKQLNSILSQLSDFDEIIVSDDSSTDNTLDIISSYNDPRIKVFVNSVSKNINPLPIYKVTQNFKNAITKASGDLIFLCDQDDEWFPDKLNSCKEIIFNENIDLLVHDAVLINQNRNLIASSYFEKFNSGKGFFKNLHKNTYLGCCMVFNSKVKKVIEDIPDSIHAHDMWIGLISEFLFNVKFLDVPLMFYIRHSSNVSFLTGESKNSLFTKLKFRFTFLFTLMYRLKFSGNV